MEEIVPLFGPCVIHKFIPEEQFHAKLEGKHKLFAKNYFYTIQQSPPGIRLHNKKFICMKFSCDVPFILKRLELIATIQANPENMNKNRL